MSERLIQLKGHPATIRKIQAIDRVPCGEREPLVRCRVALEVEDLTDDQLKTTASPEAAIALHSRVHGGEGQHVDRLAIKRTYTSLVVELEQSDIGKVTFDTAKVVLTPMLRGVEGCTVFAFTVEVDLEVEQCAELLRLLGSEVALTTIDLQMTLLAELQENDE